MANQSHLDLLKQGTFTWNMWRREYLHIQPDLSGADLSGADLRGGDLRGTDLEGM
ncbi:MAG: pentapeptide repeat-containing protein, partial [Ktedonobacteraceae bacterium]